MVYTSNVPQASQAIATTQPIIQANFGFLAASIGQEHNFNASGTGTDTYHLKASMPSQSDPAGALTAPITGVYYVSGGKAKFYNNTQVGGALLLPILAATNFSVGASPTFTITLRSSYNIASVVRTAEGLFTVTFTNALPNANYCVQLTGMRNDSSVVFGMVQGNATYGSSVSTTNVKIQFVNQQATNRDVLMGNLLVYGL
jgi:hypothetical protein